MTAITVTIGGSAPLAPNLVKDYDLRVPDEGTFYQVEYDWRLAQYNYEPKQWAEGVAQKWHSMPSTRMLWELNKHKPSGFIPMTESWQLRTYELMRYVVGPIPEDGEPEYWFVENEDSFPIGNTRVKVPKGTLHSYPKFPDGSVKNMYADAFLDHRALSDGHAYNSIGVWGRDVVLGVNLENPRPWEIKGLTFQGTMLKICENPLDDDGRPEPIDPRYHYIEAMDYLKPAPPLQWILENKSHLISFMTEMGSIPFPFGAKGRARQWPVSHFPQGKLVSRRYGIMPEAGTPHFVVGRNGWNTVLKVDCTPVTNGAPYSIYWPPK